MKAEFDIQQLTLYPESLTDASDVIYSHPGNARVAVVTRDEAFIRAAQSPDFDAVMHMGFKHDEMDEYYATLTPEQRKELS